MEWQVHSLSHYNTFQLEDAQDMGLSVALLIPLDDAHKNNGSFKIHLFGGEDENISIQTTEIFPKVPAALANSRLNFPFNPSQQLIPDNCMAGTWRDAVTMISQNNITVTDSEGEIIPSREFLRILSTVLVEPSTSQAAEKYNSGYNPFCAFEESCNKKFPWPLSKEVWRAFIIWCHSARNLSKNSIHTYLSALKYVHTLKGFSHAHLSYASLSAALLKGVEHSSLSYITNPNTRRVMTLPLLLTLREKIAQQDWDSLDKQVLWAASTTAFFGST
ncbi:MAG: hypothetical protein ACK55I_06395, partial [bacterium]